MILVNFLLLVKGMNNTIFKGEVHFLSPLNMTRGCLFA